MNIQEIMEGSSDLTFESVMIKIIIGLVAVLIIIITFFFLIKLLQAKITGRSLSEVMGGSSHRKINSTLKGSDLSVSSNPHGFIFGKSGSKKAFLPSDMEGHIIVFGGSGKGKTSALLIPSLRSWLGTFFAIDISGDISSNVDCENKIILAPDDPEHSVLYNVFRAIDNCATENEKRKKLELLTNLIVEIPPNVNDTQHYFLNTGRKILKASLFAFYNLGYDFIEICRVICFNNLDDLFDMIDAAGDKTASSIISSMRGANEKNINGAKETLEDKIGLFANDANIEQILRRPQEWFDDGMKEPSFELDMLEHSRVFLLVPDREQEYYAAFMRIVTGQVLDYVYTRKFKRGKSQRILIALDEFASLGHLELLAPFRKFRKFGANLCVLTQELADVDLTYSEKERKAIIGNCKYIAVLNAVEPDTKKYFSEIIGKEQVERVSTSQNKSGGSTSKSIAEEYAVDPGEWNELGDNLVVIHPHGYVKLALNFYYKEDKRRKKSA